MLLINCWRRCVEKNTFNYLDTHYAKDYYYEKEFIQTSDQT
jgi:hypothetical protein